MHTLTLDRTDLEANRRRILIELGEVQAQLAHLRDTVESQIDQLTQSEGENRASE